MRILWSGRSLPATSEAFKGLCFWTRREPTRGEYAWLVWAAKQGENEHLALVVQIIPTGSAVFGGI